MNWRFVRNVLLKAAGLFVLLNMVMVLFQPVEAIHTVSIYNHLVPGRERFPFGEDPAASYSLTTNSLNALFSSHTIHVPKGLDEYRVVILGDSSVWGTLLRSEKTLAGILNTRSLTTSDERRVVFYNLGYPTLSLWKDVLILDRAMQHDPDLIIWVMTLESFPDINPQESPLLAANQEVLAVLAGSAETDTSPGFISALKASVIGARRELADWMRLQLYGVMWAATGIDQAYPDSYEPAQRDLENDTTLNGIEPVEMLSILDAAPIQAGMKLAGNTPVLIVNEPILISTGRNSDIRYNYYYPRWAYDGYREWLKNAAGKNEWCYLDAWDLVGEQDFTNTAIHLNESGEAQLADAIAEYLKVSYPNLFP